MTASLDSSISSIGSISNISSGSSFSSGSGAKKTVSFPDNVVSEVHRVEKNDKALNEELFYSQQDFRRFKEERRLTKIKSQRMACRSKSRRRGIMYETVIPSTTRRLLEHRNACEILVPIRTTNYIEHRLSRMNLIMEIDNEARPGVVDAF